ncbi:MAG: hypothetical protein ABIT36_09400 [Steroidobacteraceae bacterium]
MLRSAFLLAMLIVSGCALQPAPAPVQPGSDRITGSALQLSAYFETLQHLAQGSPAEQAELFAAARAAHQQSPSGATQLRYALALAAPLHPARDPVAAQRLLREVLATPETLTSAERAVGYLELQRLDAELKLEAENSRLVTEAQRNLARERNNNVAVTASKRLQSEVDENARLRKALDEAQSKLDAIANIERNITDRKPPANEVRKP